MIDTEPIVSRLQQSADGDFRSEFNDHSDRFCGRRAANQRKSIPKCASTIVSDTLVLCGNRYQSNKYIQRKR